MLTCGTWRRDVALVPQVQHRLLRLIQVNGDLACLERHRTSQLTAFLRTVVTRSPYYQDPAYQRVLAAPEPERHLAEIPLLDKDRLREMTSVAPRGRRRRLPFTARTSGSTGVPLNMVFGPEHYVSYYARFAHFLWRRRLWPTPLSMSMMTVSAFQAVIDYRVLQPAINCTFYRRINIHPSHWTSPAAPVACVSAARPLVLRGMATSLETLAQRVAEDPPPAPIRPAVVVSVAETLLPATRRLLESTFGAEVIDEYGLTEVGGVVGSECAANGGFHVQPLDYLVEVVGPDGAPLPDGREGEIVVTNLYATVVPLLRYRTGDFGTITSEPCRCGSVAPRIARLTGRALSRFVGASGAAYNPYDEYGRLLLALPMIQFQLAQVTDRMLLLRYRGNRDITDLPEVPALRERVASVHGAATELRVERVTAFEEGPKFHAFVRMDQQEAVEAAAAG